MSASREKKQRQSAGPSDKAVKAQQEQAARKRQTVIYSITGGIIAVLVAALLVWRSGFFQARAAAATVGGETLTAAELSYYYYGTRQNAAMYASYGLSTFDSSKPDDEQFYNETENQTYRDYFMETALKSAQQHLAMYKEALNAGHTEAEVKEDLDAEIADAKSAAAAYNMGYGAYLKNVYGDYMTSGIYEKLTARYLVANLAAEEHYNELYDGYTQSDLDAYYKENADTLDTIEYSYLYFSIPTVDTKDEEGNDLDDAEVNRLKEEAQADTKRKAEEALKAVESGSSFDSQKEKYELTSGSDHAKVVGTGSINSSYSEQLLKLGKGECELVEIENGCYVISFHDRYLDVEPTRDVRHILIRAETTTDDSGNVVAPTDEAWAAAKAKMDEIQAAWDAGDKTEDAFAALANEKSDDGDGSTGGLYERSADGRFVTEFNDWVFDSSRSPGDVGLVRHEGDTASSNSYWGYHLIYYVGENEPVWMGTVRSTLTSEAQSTWIDELAANFPATQQSGANHLGN